jgi:hypothetical protein
MRGDRVVVGYSAVRPSFRGVQSSVAINRRRKVGIEIIDNSLQEWVNRFRRATRYGALNQNANCNRDPFHARTSLSDD